MAGTATVADHSYPEITELLATSFEPFDPDRDNDRDDDNRDGDRARGGGDAGKDGAGARAEEKESVGESADHDPENEHKREEAGTTVATAGDVSQGSMIAGGGIGSPPRRRGRRVASNGSPQGMPVGDTDASGSNHLRARLLDARNNEGEALQAPDKVENSDREQGAEEYSYHAH